MPSDSRKSTSTSNVKESSRQRDGSRRKEKDHTSSPHKSSTNSHTSRKDARDKVIDSKKTKQREGKVRDESKTRQKDKTAVPNTRSVTKSEKGRTSQPTLEKQRELLRSDTNTVKHNEKKGGKEEQHNSMKHKIGASSTKKEDEISRTRTQQPYDQAKDPKYDKKRRDSRIEKKQKSGYKESRSAYESDSLEKSREKSRRSSENSPTKQSLEKSREKSGRSEKYLGQQSLDISREKSARPSEKGNRDKSSKGVRPKSSKPKSARPRTAVPETEEIEEDIGTTEKNEDKEVEELIIPEEVLDRDNGDMFAVLPEQHYEQKEKSVELADNEPDPKEDYEDFDYGDEEFEDYDSDFEEDSGSEPDDEEQSNQGEAKNEEGPDSGIYKEEPEITYTRPPLHHSHSATAEESVQGRYIEDENIHVVGRREPPPSPENNGEGVSLENHKQQLSLEVLSGRPQTARTFINFSFAKKHEEKNKVLNKTMKRGMEVLEFVTLDSSTFDLFDLPPVKYEIYIRNFGRSNTKQVTVQTDNFEDEEIQTDELDNRDKWTQKPPHDHLGVGGDVDRTVSGGAGWSSVIQTDAVQLTHFVQNASQFILTLLDEELAEENQQQLTFSEGSANFSRGFLRLGFIPFRIDCPVTSLAFSTTHTNYLLTIHGSPHEATETPELDEKGIICVWNINNPSKPEEVLTSSVQPVCCSFSPGNITVVFAGMVDGSVVLWDLRESSSWHKSYWTTDPTEESVTEWTLRSPTYNSANVLKEEGHHSSVVCVRPVVYSSNGLSSNISHTSQETFQVITLEDQGVVNVWVMMEIAQPQLSGSETDLGLAPGGRLKLVKGASIYLQDLPGLSSSLKNGIRCFDLHELPSDPSHLFVTTDAGIVLHCTRHGSKANPKFYRPSSDVLTEVRSLDFSPHGLPYFLVGCSDGNVRLYNIKSDKPLISWPNATNGESIVRVQWSASHPSMFYVLDISSRVHVWNLVENLSSPLHSSHFANGIVTHFAVSCDPNIMSLAASDGQPQLAISMDTGVVEVHRLDSNSESVASSDYEKLKNYMLNL